MQPTNTTTIQESITQIRQILAEATIPTADIELILQDLNTLIQANLTDELMKELTEEDIDKLETSSEIDKNDPAQLAEFLDLTEEDITGYYEDSLAEYIRVLPEQIPAIKNRLEELLP
jgi:hypothetical protein